MRSPTEIVFTRSATESVNLVAYSFGARFLKPGDRSWSRARAPRQHRALAAAARPARHARSTVIPIDGDGDIDLDALDRRWLDGAKLLR